MSLYSKILFFLTWAITIFAVALGAPGAVKKEATSRLVAMGFAGASMAFLVIALVPVTLSAIGYDHHVLARKRQIYVYLIAIGAASDLASTVCISIAAGAPGLMVHT